MMITKFSDVMKRFRRGAHVHAHHWRAIMVFPSVSAMNAAWDDALATMQGSSHARGLVINNTQRRIATDNGAVMQFAIVDPMDAEDQLKLRMAGTAFTQLVWFGQYAPAVVEIGEAHKRSNGVAPEDTVTQFSEVQ